MIEVLIFIFGAMIGSFLNVCIYRMPLEISIAKPARSFCPSCQKQIPWYLNIPLFSYLMLKGKCHFCQIQIPFRYFAVELITALAFMYLWSFSAGDVVLFGIRVIFISMLIVIVATDFEHKFIPDLITFPGMVFGLIFSLVPGALFSQHLWYDRLAHSALGLLGGYGVLFLTAVIGNWLFRKESMGGGDLKLMGMLGAFIGFQKVFYVFMLAPFIALPFAFWYKAVKKEEEFPFGPFLAFWGAAFFLYGDFLTRLMNQLYGVS